MKPSKIISELLHGDDWARKLIGEASVHRPRRGKIWVASFTGVEGQQWRSTGTEDHALALARAREFEAAARVERTNKSMTAGPSLPRFRRSHGGAGQGLTQREIALLLGLSERAVRAIEKRALRKLAQHPDLRGIWRQFQAGELTEQAGPFSDLEIKALLGLTRNLAERHALQQALRQILTPIGHSRRAEQSAGAESTKQAP